MGKRNWVTRACFVSLLWATAAIALPAQTFKTLHNFDNTDGFNPDAGLVQATNGNLYGTTIGGGANGEGGTVFKITPSGTFTTLYNFCSQSNCTDGVYPYAGLVQGNNGDLYGTTDEGGGANFAGTVFKITPSGTLTTLYSFCSQVNNGVCTDGSAPLAGLVMGTNGDFYGTTVFGGANSCEPPGCGTIFKITPSGTLTMLHSFDGTDGWEPFAALVQAADGNFYGTTSRGGNIFGNSYGTVFKITPRGKLTTLHSFNVTDGNGPTAPLIQATDGSLYGTTVLGGANNNAGTVFKITPSGTFTTLYNFCSQSNCTDGVYPYAGLVQATDGEFYATTGGGGAAGDGTVFKITPGGTLTTLHSFDGVDGSGSQAGLIQDTNGMFYGTTAFGGTNICAGSGCGTIFSLSVGLGPFLKTLPVSGTVGTTVSILGTNLTGATKVTFHGTPATFTVVSSSEITTSVPTGATNGLVKVVTPSGTLSSNVPFQVLP